MSTNSTLFLQSSDVDVQSESPTFHQFLLSEIRFYDSSSPPVLRQASFPSHELLCSIMPSGYPLLDGTLSETELLIFGQDPEGEITRFFKLKTYYIASLTLRKHEGGDIEIVNLYSDHPDLDSAQHEQTCFVRLENDEQARLFVDCLAAVQHDLVASSLDHLAVTMGDVEDTMRALLLMCVRDGMATENTMALAGVGAMARRRVGLLAEHIRSISFELIARANE